MTLTQTSRPARKCTDDHRVDASRDQTSPLSTPVTYAQRRDDGGEQTSPETKGPTYTHARSVSGEQTSSGSAGSRSHSLPMVLTTLADPLLALLADVREDALASRIANENRLRHLTRDETDKDGEERGLGLDDSHPDVARLAALVEMLAQVEHQARLNLNRQMRKHPLAPWCKAQTGIGHGTLPARLLSILGDPYINVATGEPRTVGQLWAYCGHGDPSRKLRKGISQDDLFRLGNPKAKMIVHLIAEGCMKNRNSPFRVVYDERKAATEGRLHAAECKRCGPSGKPAQPGSPWSDAHRHADALRVTGKAILKGMWAEAKRLHEER